MDNPFRVHTPEQLTAADVAANFVELHTDFPKIKEPINMFIHGARGTGKSMMLRSLEPAVQKLFDNSSNSNDLSFYAVRVPIKQTVFGNPELQRLDGWTASSVGEHLLCIYTLMWICEALDLEKNDPQKLVKFVQTLRELFEDCGGKESHKKIKSEFDFKDVANFCEGEVRKVRQYYLRLPSENQQDIYGGALTSFQDFLLPLIRCLRENQIIYEVPICAMIDDADNLPEAIQRVLNTWISMRYAQYICFKVTTQLGYKTYRTVDNRIIESPHDFSEVNVGTVYTSNKDTFSQRIYAIVEKRLQNSGINVSPENFFPMDSDQNKRLLEIQQNLANDDPDKLIELKGSGASRTRDNVQRYAIPALMRELTGKNRSSHTFSYSGLRSLTDLSSGIVRWFLEPASRMYHDISKPGAPPPKFIPVGKQDEIMLDWSREFRNFLSKDPGSPSDEQELNSLHSHGHTPQDYQDLRNLIDGVGLLCREKILDKTASEQRVFSIVLSDQPSKKLDFILQLGVRLGYFQKADTASKSSIQGRRPRYILSRRLGPYYRLDVSGYAAHLSVKCVDLEVALADPKEFVKKRLKPPTDDQQVIEFGFKR